ETRGTLAIAVPLTVPAQTDSKILNDRVVVFSRTRRSWTTTVIPTQRVAYVALGPSPSGGLLLAVIRNDPSLTFDDNSLFLYERGSLETPWRDVGRLVQGGRMPVHNPQLSLDDSGAVITYSAGAGGFVNMEGRALL